LLIGSRGYGQKEARANASRLGKLQYQNFQNEAANYQLTELAGGGVSGATANLGICDKGGQVHSVSNSLIVCLHIPATP